MGPVTHEVQIYQVRQPDWPSTIDTVALLGTLDAGGTSKGGDQDDEGPGSNRARVNGAILWSSSQRRMEHCMSALVSISWMHNQSLMLTQCRKWMICWRKLDKPSLSPQWISVRYTGRRSSIQPPDNIQHSRPRLGCTNLRSFLLACMRHLPPFNGRWIKSSKAARTVKQSLKEKMCSSLVLQSPEFSQHFLV